MVKNLITLCLCSLFTCLIHAQVEEGQPLPSTPMEEALNQYAHLCINTGQQEISYKPEGKLKLGRMTSTFTEYHLVEEMDHFAVVLSPLGSQNDASVLMELIIDNETFSISYDGYGNVSDGNGVVIGSISNPKEKLILGYDDERAFMVINDEIINSTPILATQENTTIRMTATGGSNDCFWFYIDASYRNSINQVNFVQDQVTIQEGESGTICIDLLKDNINAPAFVRMNLITAEGSHFNGYTPLEFEIPVGSAGPVCLSLPTIANGLEDDISSYDFELELLSGHHMILGDKSRIKVNVIDDFVPLNNSLAPGDLMFVGLETDIGGGEDQIVITNLAPLNPGTKFQITNARYRATDDVFLSNFPFGFSSIEIEYMGSEPLSENTIFCMYTGRSENTNGTYIERIELNGEEATDQFTFENVGSSDEYSIELNTSSTRSLFLLQGQWVHLSGTESKLIGKVINAIQIGESWSVDQFPEGDVSNEHPDVECVAIEGPGLQGSGWAYFQCQTPYNRITIYDLKKEISDFNNWVSGNGDDQVNWPEGVDVCVSTCDVGEYDPLSIAVEDISVYCDGMGNELNEVQLWLEEMLNTSVTGGCYLVNVSHNFSESSLQTCQSYAVEFTATDECGESVSATGMISVLDTIAPVFENVQPYLELDCFSEFMLEDIVATDLCSDVTVTQISEEVISESFAVERLVRKTFMATDQCGNSTTIVQDQLLDQSNGFTVDIGGDLTICENDQVDLNSTISGAIAPISGLWYQQGNIGSSGVNSPYTVYGNQGSSISLSVTDARGCQARDVILLNVPDLSVDINGSLEYYLCGNNPQDITLSATISGFGSQVEYSWWNHDTGIELASVPTYTRPYGSGIVDIGLFVTDVATGCIKESERIYVEDIEESITLSGPTTICPGNVVTINANVTEESGGFDYEWYIDVGGGFRPLHSTDPWTDYDEDFITLNLSQSISLMYEADYGNCIYTETISIVVNDVMPPSITCPSDFTVQSDSNCEYFLSNITSQVGATDPCSGVQELLQSPVNVTLDGGQSVSILFTARDFFNNTSSCATQITIEKNGDFEVTCPGDITVDLHDYGECVYVIPDFEPQVSVVNDCDIIYALIQTPESGIINTPGINTVVVEATRGNNLYGSCQVNITVVPSFNSFPSDVTINCETGCCIDHTGEAISCVPGSSVSYMDDQSNSCLTGSCGACGLLTRTWTITYSDGTTYSQDQLITVNDNEGAEATSFLVCDSNYSPSNDYRADLAVVDNCSHIDDITITQDGVDQESLPGSGMWTRFYTIVDRCGNFSSAEQVIDASGCNNLRSTEYVAVDKDFRVYPNPATNEFFIEYLSEVEEQAELLIYKMSGELLVNSKVSLQEGLNVKELDCSEFYPGMYLIRMKTAEKEYTEKLIIIN